LYRNGEAGFKPQGTAQEFIQGFHVFDKDNSGLISSGELRYVLTSLGDKLTDDEVNELMRAVEVDKNGYVNYEQFVHTILSG
jgi:Ca2+-binding EF-hand superfamily protein